ncbi:selenium-binding protein SBP56-related protein, partial [Pyrobaculum sp.]|uniref:selenium-binding protein SBP56-related protein n=1 Tax=Pyrobaculum sp. TaxID=2004705 RepID=UPI003180E972
VSLWGVGELRQYDITNPHQPRLGGRVKIGGLYHREPLAPSALGPFSRASRLRDPRRLSKKKEL